AFFFSSRRRHTRSLRDWSSDVCSSDLPLERAFAGALGIGGGGIDPGHAVVVIAETELGRDHHRIALAANGTTDQFLIDQGAIDRSEERRVGKECRSARPTDQ